MLAAHDCRTVGSGQGVVVVVTVTVSLLVWTTVEADCSCANEKLENSRRERRQRSERCDAIAMFGGPAVERREGKGE